MRISARIASAIAALAFGLTSFCAARPVDAQATSPTISGRVLDANTSLPLSGVLVAAQGPSSGRARTDANGSYTISNLTPGEYTLSASFSGYQTAQSETIVLGAGATASATLSLQRAVAGSAGLQTIGRTTTSYRTALQSASVVYRSVTTAQVVEQGQYRVADVLKNLPGLFDTQAQTAAPADDIRFAIRGIGTLETIPLFDGHPIGQGLPGGFSFELSPTVAIRDTSVVYGSGSDLYPVNAIGGVIDMRTIEPTKTPQSTLIANYGTWGKSGLLFQSTGTLERVGYAFGVSTQGTEGYQRHARLYNFSAAVDPSGGPGTPGFNSGIYDVDTSSNVKTVFGKVRFSLTPTTRVTFNALTTGFYDDKTGNGDNDYQTPDYTFANGPAPGSGGCGAGLYPTGNTAQPCVNAADFQARFGGWNGAGPAWQSFHMNDYRMLFETKLGGGDVAIDAFGDNYAQHYDRQYQLPYVNVPGDQPNTFDNYSSNAGVTISDTYRTERNSFSFGGYASNLTFSGSSTNVKNDPATGNPLPYSTAAGGQAHETSFFLRDSYQFPGAPITVFGNLWQKHSTATNSSSTDPRLALVWTPRNQVVRLAFGATSTQPDLSVAGGPFRPVAVGSLVGAKGTLVAIGTLPAPGIRPERGVDEELSYGLRYGRNSLIQLTGYSTNVYDKLYSVRIPTSSLAPGTIDPGALAALTAALAKYAPKAAPGVNITQNLAQVRARGFEANGVQELPAGFRIDYDYAAESTALVSADPAVLKRNLNLIPGSQLPNIPLHRYNAGLAWERNGYTARLGYFHESENNPRNLPAYGYANLALAGKLGPGRLAVFVDNLFNQRADYRGLEFSGYPYALNQYADPTPGGDYTPQLGAAATEQFGLPFRTINFTYTIRVR